MNFIEKILSAIGNAIKFIGDILIAPFKLLYELLVGIFYLIAKLFEVLIETIKLFVALFQFLFSIVTGLVRTISSWIGFTPSTSYSMPSTSRQGFEAVIDQLGGTGLFNTIPLILIAIIWIWFAIKIVGLFGNKGVD